MKIHQFSVQQAISSLKSSPEGLTSGQAKRRFEEFGPNRIERIERESLVVQFLKGFTHLFALILWLAALLAFVAEWMEPGEGMATLGFAIIGVIFVNGVFSFWQEYKAEQAVQLLRKLIPHQVKVVRDGRVSELEALQLVPGDIVLLEEGDDVPADCRIIQGFGVRVNNATVTGESTPLFRDEAVSGEENLVQSRNVLLAGTSVISGEARALVFATGMHTEFGKIAHLTQAHGGGPSPLQKEVAFLSRVIAYVAAGSGLIFFFVGHELGFPFWEALIFGIGVIAANVPEGLLPTVTLALAMGSQRMARKAALIRHLPAVETLGSASVICTDKTGTLTQNRMTVEKIFLGGQLHERSRLKEAPARFEGYRRFFECAFFCQSVKEAKRDTQVTLVGDPTEIALVEMARELGSDFGSSERVDEIPFDSDRKRFSVLQRTRDGLILYSKGALETLLPLCDKVHMGGSSRPLAHETREAVLEAQNTMAAEGLRVLGLAYRDVPEACRPEVRRIDQIENGLVFMGLAGLDDPPRPEVPLAIKKCRSAGIQVVMLTGDHPRTAEAIAKRIGLVSSDHPRVLTGEELKRISDTQLQLVLSEREILFARLGADQKMRIVSALKRKKEVVAVTGDGVNDAPALKVADIGIAMGISGTDVAKDASDMVLVNDNFASIVDAVEEGRAVFENIRKFLTYILTHNVAELVPYLAYSLFRIPLPLTVIQILSIDLGTDTVPALGLGVEEPDPEVMTRPPRRPTERLVTTRLLLRAYLFLGLIEGAAALSGFFFVLSRGGWHYGQSFSKHDPIYLKATTACLSTIIVMQIANLFICRSDRKPAFVLGGNRLMFWGLGAEVALILLIDYTDWGNAVFGTSPLPASAWLFAVPFAVGMLVIEEIRKWALRTLVP